MPTLKAFAAQLFGCVAVLVILAAGIVPAPHPLALALMQGGFAAAASGALRAAKWWLPIHLLFAPALVLANRLDVAPGWFLAAFLLLAFTYWSSFRTQVPLYLSSAAVADALLELLPRERPARLIDLGCGTGRLLHALARRRPDCRFVGLEVAPLPFLVARLGALKLANCEIRRADFWSRDLQEFDLAYAFLSPVPMPRLWRKALTEMRPGALLVSNSFPVSGAEPLRVVRLGDARRTTLYLYQPAKPELQLESAAISGLAR